VKNVLHASLSPAEEIALRRVANGAPSIEGAAKAKLLALVLIESTRRGWRLTPAGLRCYEALPKAPLLTRGKSVRVVTQYIEGVIEKAQSRRHMVASSSVGKQMAVEHQAFEQDQPSEPQKKRQAGVGQDGSTPLLNIQTPAPRYPTCEAFNAEWKQYLLNARTSIESVRRRISIHQRDHVHRYELSGKRVDASWALLRQTRLQCHPPATP
jgi:hypothetical protein